MAQKYKSKFPGLWTPTALSCLKNHAIAHMFSQKWNGPVNKQSTGEQLIDTPYKKTIIKMINFFYHEWVFTNTNMQT